MRTRHLLTAITALTVVAVLSGCTPAKLYDKTATSTSSPTPVFASEEEALAAAEEVYRSYLAMSDLIAQEGGVDPERLAVVVTDGWLLREIESFERLQSSGLRQVGTSEYENFSLQQYFEDAESSTVIAYVCVDTSRTAFVDASGRDVTSPNRNVRFSVEATFVAGSTSTIRLQNNEPWHGASSC